MKKSKDLLSEKQYAPMQLGKICILGLGKTGYVAADYCASLIGYRADSVTVYAGKKTQQSLEWADKLIKKGADVVFDTEDILANYDLCIASPGISVNSGFFKSADKQSREVISEIEFAWRESNKNAKWVAVTGTNGKTTTTEMVNLVLERTGRHTVAVGNIGNVALQAVASSSRKSIYERTDIYVVEVSSYQLELTSKFAPDVAVLLNITPDHLSWHGSFEAYKRAKMKIFERAKSAVINIDDPVINELLPEIATMVSPAATIKNTRGENVYGQGNGSYFIEVEYKEETHKIIDVNKLKIKGEHGAVDARAAASVGVLAGLSDNAISDVLYNFKPLEHRLEPCGTVRSIKCFNDSKATNVDATLVAIDSFMPDNAVFLLGGKDKNTDLEQLVRVAHKHLVGVVCFGQAADRFYSAFKEYDNSTGFSKYFFIERANNMEDAFKKALEIVKPGMSIVLSPACSSFDEFTSFEKRGEAFKELVEGTN